MGIFTRWRIFTKSEVVLEERINNNPFHPFQQVGGDKAALRPSPLSSVYVYACRQKRFYGAVFVCLASLLFIVIWPSAGGDPEYLGFGFSALLLSGYVAVEYYSVRRLVLDPETHHYSVYKGNTLLATEHCHNIFIRLMSKAPGSQEAEFYLVLDGVGLEEAILLAKPTTNKKKLRHLAHTLTSNLNLNYFDVHDTSKHHIIRHKRPQVNITETANDHEE